MPRSTVRPMAGLALLASATLAALAVAAVPARAGEPVADPAFDFDCDDVRDAVDGDQYADVDGQSSAGAVTVQYGATGVKTGYTQATPGIAGGPETGDQFGGVVAAFDEDGDGCDDLVVGAPYEDVADAAGVNRADSGMVWIIPGSPSGLDPAASRGFHLDSPGIPGSVAAQQYFGRALSGGATIDGQSYLFMGADGADAKAGAVYYLRDGVVDRLGQDTPGVSGAAEPGDAFGFRIATADNYVAISSIGEAIGTQDRAGMVHVFGFDFETGELAQLDAVHQDSPGVSGTAEAGDHFGLGLSVAPFRPTSNSPVMPLLSVGAPDEDLKSVDFGVDAGLTHLLSIPAPGSHRQIAALDEGSAGVPGEVAGYDGFGTDTVLAVTAPTTIGTPATTRWVVAAAGYDAPNEWNHHDATVFGVTDDPTAEATLIKGDDFGLPIYDNGTLDSLDASADYLYFTTESGADAVYGVPWANILDGATEPTVVHEVTD